MAYTPTRQQRSGVTTTGTVQATGMQRLANAFNKISERVDRERALDRQQLFDMAVIQAQADGKSSVKFDDEGKLIPLTDTAYEPGMFYKTDEAKVKQVFEKFMTQTYTTAFNTDVSIAASEALSDNPHNPEAIVAVAEEYEKNINSLPENLQNAVRPAFMRAFAQSEISARSALNKIVNEQTIATGLDRLAQLKQNLGNHYFNAGISGEKVDQDIIQMDIKEIEDIRENLEMIMPKSRLDEIINVMYTDIQGQLFNGRIEKVFNEGTYTDALKEINLLQKELNKSTDGTINVDRVVREGKTYLASLQSAVVAAKQANKELSTESAGTINLAIAENEIKTESELKNHPLWNNVTDGEQSTLINIINNKNKVDKNEAKAKLVDHFKEKMADVHTNMYNLTQAGGLPNMLEVSQLEGLAGSIRKEATQNGMFNQIQTKYLQVLQMGQKALLAHIKENNDIALEIVMGELRNGEFEHPPNYYKDETFVDTLFAGKPEIKFSLGTKDEDIMTRAKWIKFVDLEYTNDWKAYNKDMYNLGKAVTQIRNVPLEPGSELYNVFNKYNVQKNITWTDSKGSTQTTSVDVLAQDEEQANASLLHAVKWTYTLRQLHPELIRAFENFEHVKSEEAYFRITSQWQTLQNTLNRQRNPQDAKLLMGELMALHDLDYEWIQRASLLPFEEFKLAMSGQRSAQTEKFKLAFPDNEGESIDDLIDNVFQKQFTEKGIASKLATFMGFNLDKDKDPDKQAVYKQMMDSANNMTQYSMFSIRPMMNLATITHVDFQSDPDLMQIIKNGVLGRIARGNYNFGNGNQQQVVEAALGDTLLSLGKSNLGLVVQGDGRIYLEKHPYMQTAKNSIPADKPLASFTELDVMVDINKKLGFAVSLTKPGDLSLPKMIKANMPFDGTYTVFGVRPDSTLVPLLPSYKPDWSTSIANEAYAEAMKDWKEGSWHQTAWAVIPFMDQVQLQLMIDSYKENKSVPNFTENLTKLVNKARYAAYFLAGEKHQYEPIQINVEDNTEFEKFADSLMSLGIY